MNNHPEELPPSTRPPGMPPMLADCEVARFLEACQDVAGMMLGTFTIERPDVAEVLADHDGLPYALHYAGVSMGVAAAVMVLHQRGLLPDSLEPEGS